MCFNVTKSVTSPDCESSQSPMHLFIGFIFVDRYLLKIPFSVESTYQSLDYLPTGQWVKAKKFNNIGSRVSTSASSYIVSTEYGLAHRTKAICRRNRQLTWPRSTSSQRLILELKTGLLSSRFKIRH